MTESLFSSSLLLDVQAAQFDGGGSGDVVGGRGQHGGGPTPPWIPTCPCLRRRPESEVLVGCSAASVSEASLAFCCVGRLNMREQTNTKQSQREKTFRPNLPPEVPG